MNGEVQWRVRPPSPSCVGVVKGWKEQEPDNVGGGERLRGTPAVFQLFCTQGQRCSWLRKELSTQAPAVPTPLLLGKSTPTLSIVD